MSLSPTSLAPTGSTANGASSVYSYTASGQPPGSVYTEVFGEPPPTAKIAPDSEGSEAEGKDDSAPTKDKYWCITPESRDHLRALTPGAMVHFVVNGQPQTMTESEYKEFVAKRCHDAETGKLYISQEPIDRKKMMEQRIEEFRRKEEAMSKLAAALEHREL